MGLSAISMFLKWDPNEKKLFIMDLETLSSENSPSLLNSGKFNLSIKDTLSGKNILISLKGLISIKLKTPKKNACTYVAFLFNNQMADRPHL